MPASYGRLIATTYLVSWPTWLVGLVSLAVSQGASWSVIVFVVGALGLAACSERAALADRDAGMQWSVARYTEFFRFVSGIELRNAWRAAQG